jgi:hypothetical protein
MLIDGDIWLASNDGSLRRYRSGREQEFSVTGLDEAFSGALQLWSEEENENIYVLEPAAQRLVALRKSDGAFVQQYTSGTLTAATAFTIDAEENVAYVTDGAGVFRIEL